MILIVIMYALFAGSYTLGKMLLTHTSPSLLAGLRMTIAGTALLVYHYFAPHKQPVFKREHLTDFAQIIFFGFYITYVLRFWGLREMPSYKAVFLHNIAPFATALYSYLLFNERISKKQIVGLLIGFVGLIPILLTSSKQEQLAGEWLFLSWPELAVIASVLASSYSWILVHKMINKNHYAPTMISGISMTFGGFLGLITACLSENALYITDPARFTALFLVVILVSNIICHTLYGHLLKTNTATFISFASFLTPLFAAFYGWAFLQERITWHFYASSFIVFIGLYLFYQDELKNKSYKTTKKSH